MIQPISQNFTGKVKLGRDPYERRKMNEALKEVPKFKRKDFLTSVMALKGAIEENTPVGAEYLINISGFNDGYLAGNKISVTDTLANKHVALDGVLKIFNGEPVSLGQYDRDMKCAFQTVALDTINYAKNDGRYGTIGSNTDYFA